MIAALLNLVVTVFAGGILGLVAVLFLVGLPWATWRTALDAVEMWADDERPDAVLYAFVAWFTGNLSVILWLAFLDWVLQ